MHDIELYPSGALSSAPGLTISPSASARAGTRVTRTTRTLRRSSSGEPGHTWHETRGTRHVTATSRAATTWASGWRWSAGRASSLPRAAAPSCARPPGGGWATCRDACPGSEEAWHVMWSCHVMFYSHIISCGVSENIMYQKISINIYLGEFSSFISFHILVLFPFSNYAQRIVQFIHFG